MTWKHGITVALLAVLTALPVSGAVCAMACGSVFSQASAHHSGQTCGEPANPSTGAQIRGASKHECSTHDAAVQLVAATVAQRPNLIATSAPFVVSTVQTSLQTLYQFEPAFDYHTLPGTAPPTTTPPVLRV